MAPHEFVKLWPGMTEAQRNLLAKRVAQAVMDVLGYGEEPVSVSMEEIGTQDGAEKVPKPDIAGKPDQLYKPPGCGLSDLA
ncbi:tautomerase family protein [bacterium]|nr:tautomerase family protein [bacterium]